MNAKATPTSQWWRDLLTAVLGLWLVAAVYADGWAHLNVPGLESFFTPWHGALYAGLTVFAAWIALLAWRGTKASGTREKGWWRTVLPAGYGLAAAGVIAFGAGGVADMIWHVLFGVEAGVDALLSPSHLVLYAGGLLMVSTSWRAVTATGSATPTVPELLSLSAAAALSAFFLSYTSAFLQATPTTVFLNIPEGAPGHTEAELPVSAALASYLVTTAIIVVPLLAAIAAKRRPPATVTVLVGLISGLSVAMADRPAVLVAGALGATAAAVVVDGLLARIRPERAANRLVLPMVAALTPILIWSGQLAGFAIADAVRWPVALWSGVVLAAGLAGAALTLPQVVRQARVQRPTALSS